MKLTNDKVFLDSNILIYLYSTDEQNKRSFIVDFVNNAAYEFIISSQVINEFINVLHKKKKINFIDLEKVVDELFVNFNVVNVTLSTIKIALEFACQNNYTYFDCLIIASAIENQCKILFSEDMHHSHCFKGITIQNPFKM